MGRIGIGADPGFGHCFGGLGPAKLPRSEKQSARLREFKNATKGLDGTEDEEKKTA